MYALNHGLPAQLRDPMIALTLAVVVTSIVVHGISVTPMMAAYEKAVRRRRK
jgi:NhaP-type Na+/H+ or K+/H+ antiporter